jgi:nucleotide-binding universal stress UspA family protein
MIRRILVPLDGSSHAMAAVDYAATLARAHHAIVEGIVVIEPHTRDAIEERSRTLLDWFKDRCNEMRVSHTEAGVQGVPAREILEEAKTYDLIVTGNRTHFHTRHPDKAGDSLSKILGETTCPILAVPDSRADRSLRKVLVAYDGSPHASHALRAFAAMAEPFTEPQPEIMILCVEQKQPRGDRLVASAASYLRSYGFGNVSTRAEPIGGILDIFHEEYRADCDLVVCGTHAKGSGLYDFVVGGFTMGLIEDGRTPILFAQ